MGNAEGGGGESKESLLFGSLLDCCVPLLPLLSTSILRATSEISTYIVAGEKNCDSTEVDEREIRRSWRFSTRCTLG